MVRGRCSACSSTLAGLPLLQSQTAHPHRRDLSPPPRQPSVLTATLAPELAKAEAQTMAKQSTQTWPQVTVPTRLAYDMDNYAERRRWSHKQAAPHDCVTALTFETPAAPSLQLRSLTRNTTETPSPGISVSVLFYLQSGMVLEYNTIIWWSNTLL
jgi:hypothetical protein